MTVLSWDPAGLRDLGREVPTPDPKVRADFITNAAALQIKESYPKNKLSDRFCFGEIGGAPRARFSSLSIF